MPCKNVRRGDGQRGSRLWRAVGCGPDSAAEGLSRARFASAVATVAFAAVAVGGDENWSRFRGPNGAGVSPTANLPVAWTDADYAWRVALPGMGHSSPIGWGGLVFATSGDSERGVVTLTAINASDGALVWSREFESPGYKMHPSNSLASSTPAADAERVYFAWARDGSLWLAALDHSGGEVWRRELGRLNFRHGFGASPVVVDDVTIMTCDQEGESFVVALDAANGELRWRRERAPGNDSYATPVLWQPRGGAPQIVVNSTAEGMTGLALSDGAVQWQAADLFSARCVSSPVVAGDLVLGGSGEGGNGRDLVAVRPPQRGAASPSAAAAELAYKLARSLPQAPTPVATDRLLFVVSDRGVVTCCDVTTGDVHWTERIGGNFFASPVVAGGALYCVAADGAVVTLAADEKFAELGRSALNESCEATPAIHQGRLYLRTERSLACVAPRGTKRASP